MTADSPQYDVLIASRTAPTYTGGLANYQLTLARECEAHIDGCKVGFLAYDAALPGTTPARALPENAYVLADVVRESRSLWMRLASRPAFHGILEKLICRAYRPAYALKRLPRAKVIHFVGTGWDFTGFAMRDLARTMGAKFTVLPATHPGNWGDDRIDLRLYGQSAAVICLSFHEAQHLARLGLPANKTTRSGLPPMCLTSGDGMRFRARFDLGSRPLVLFAGRRDADKGYSALCSAWRRVLERCPDACLVLAGPCREAALEQPPATAICDIGIPDDEMMADAFAAADVFCLPSAHESFGLVYVEAWSYGKPVICGTAPAAREWVRESGGGIFSDREPETLSNAIHTLLDDPDLRQKLGAAGHAFQQRMLSPAQFVENHRRVFGI